MLIHGFFFNSRNAFLKMKWVVVMQPKPDIDYQILDAAPPERPKPDWGKVLQKAASAIISNLVWWYITK